jgi:hypothetical protein
MGNITFHDLLAQADLLDKSIVKGERRLRIEKWWCRRYKCSGKWDVHVARAESYDAPQLWGEFQCDCDWIDDEPYLTELDKSVDLSVGL